MYGRVTPLQILEAARLAVIRTTSSEDCFLIFPHELIVSHIKFGTEAVSIDQENPLLGSDEDRWIDTEQYVGSQLITFEPNQPKNVKVRLELSDLEYMALYHGRTLSSPLPTDDVTKSLLSEELGAAGTMGPPITTASWTARRISGRVSIDHGHETAVGGNRGLLSVNVLAAPWSPVGPGTCTAKDGRFQAVVTACRSASPYAAVDKDVIFWLGRVLTHCLSMSLNALDKKDWKQTLSGLQAEVNRLSTQYGITSHVEANLELFVDSLIEDSLYSTGNAGTSGSDRSNAGTALAELYSFDHRQQGTAFANPVVAIGSDPSVIQSTESMALPSSQSHGGRNSMRNTSANTNSSTNSSTNSLKEDALEYSMEARILSAAEFVFGVSNVSLLFATRADIPLGDIALTPPFDDSFDRSQSMNVKSRFGFIDAWVDKVADDTNFSHEIRRDQHSPLPTNGLSTSLAKTIAKLQFQYQIANLRSAAGSVAAAGTSSSSYVAKDPYFLDHSYLKRDLDKIKYDQSDSVLMIIKFRNGQQALLLRILPSDKMSEQATLQLDKVWRLRCVLLLRLVDSEVPWIDKLAAKNLEVSRLETELTSYKSRAALDVALKQDEIDHVSAISKELTVSQKERYKSILRERSKLYSLGELFQIAGIVSSHQFNQSMKSACASYRPNDRRDDTPDTMANYRDIPRFEQFAPSASSSLSSNMFSYLRRQLRSSVEHVCLSIAAATDSFMHLGIIFNADSTSSDNTEGLSNIDWVRVDRQGAHRKPISPQGNSLGKSIRRPAPPRPSQNPARSPPNPAQNSTKSSAAVGIRSPSSPGSTSISPDVLTLGTCDPAIQLALHSGSMVLVSSVAGDPSIQRAEEHALSLLHQAGYQVNSASSTALEEDIESPPRAVVVITTACGHPPGTLFVPLQFPGLDTSFVVLFSTLTVGKHLGINNSDAKSNREDAGEENALNSGVRASATILSAQLITWHLLSRNVANTVRECVQSCDLRQKHIRSFVNVLNSSIHEPTTRKISLECAFQKLKLHSLGVDTKESIVVAHKLEDANHTIAQLERSLADWTELSKGISGSYHIYLLNTMFSYFIVLFLFEINLFLWYFILIGLID